MVTILLIIGFLLLLLSLLLRLLYRLLPYELVLIEDVSCHTEKNEGTKSISCIISYHLNKKLKKKLVNYSINSTDSLKNDTKLNELNELKGKKIKCYKIPFVPNIMYLDQFQLLPPLWPYLIVIIIYLLPLSAVILYQYFGIYLPDLFFSFL